MYIYIHIYTYIYTQSAQVSQKQDERNIYVIMKTMCPPGYHHNGFVATHALYIYIYARINCQNQLVMSAANSFKLMT